MLELNNSNINLTRKAKLFGRVLHSSRAACFYLPIYWVNFLAKSGSLMSQTFFPKSTNIPTEWVEKLLNFS